METNSSTLCDRITSSLVHVGGRLTIAVTPGKPKRLNALQDAEDAETLAEKREAAERQARELLQAEANQVEQARIRLAKQEKKRQKK